MLVLTEYPWPPKTVVEPNEDAELTSSVLATKTATNSADVRKARVLMVTLRQADLGIASRTCWMVKGYAKTMLTCSGGSGR